MQWKQVKRLITLANTWKSGSETQIFPYSLTWNGKPTLPCVIGHDIYDNKDNIIQ